MTVGSGESDEDGPDAPPSYGDLHGRVLKTGRPAPPGPAFPSISNQDLEESDGDY